MDMLISLIESYDPPNIPRKKHLTKFAIHGKNFLRKLSSKEIFVNLRKEIHKNLVTTNIFNSELLDHEQGKNVHSSLLINVYRKS
jgi:hypothetical protein